MLIGGLYEAHLDYRIVKYVQAKMQPNPNDPEASGPNLDDLRQLLVTITSGNLMLEEGDPQTVIPASLTIAGVSEDVMTGIEKSRSRLLNLLGAQSSFGSAVGSPVVFYLGAFAYTILDLKNDPSDEGRSYIPLIWNRMDDYCTRGDNQWMSISEQ